MNRQALVSTKSGKIEGVFEKGLFSFKGIPFAEPPVGNLRWMPPVPVKEWDGTLKAKEYGAMAPQVIMPVPIPGVPVFKPLPLSEDCLFLNIWTSGLDDAKRPVLFWIHGGAFILGSGCEPYFENSTLPERGDIVIVSINYRLGAFGFLNLNEVTGRKIPSTGNEALLDQVLALEWVIENIRSFGGDPDNITLGGFSAGGMCIGSLLTMPNAKGKFQKAINRSGSANVVGSVESAVEITEKYLNILGISAKDTDALRSASTDKLLNAQNILQEKLRNEEFRSAPFEPIMDGSVIPEWPLKALKNGAAKNIPVLAGTSLDELKTAGLMDPGVQKLDMPALIKRLETIVPADDVNNLAKIYKTELEKRNESNKPSDIWGTITTDYLFRIGTIKLTEYQCINGAQAYNYLFKYKSSAMDGALGAMHGLDNPFFFGVLDPEFSGNGQDQQLLSQKIQDSAIAFMRTGNPSCKSIGKWPVYGKERNTMILDTSTSVETNIFKEETKFWDKFGLVSSRPL